MINTVLTSLLIILIGFSSSISFAEDNYVPNWIKDTAGFWAEDKISDQDFLQSLQYLIDNDFLLIPHDENLTFEPKFCKYPFGLIYKAEGMQLYIIPQMPSNAVNLFKWMLPKG